MKQQIDLKQLTTEQREELMAQLAKEQAEKKNAIENERKEYKAIVSRQVTSAMSKLQELSTKLSEDKQSLLSDFRAIIDMKCELYELDKDAQLSHTFSSEDGSMRIKIGYYTTDNWDDTVNAGVKKVQDYITTLATDTKTKQLVNMVNKLLAKDNTGNLKASRVLQLKKHAEESGCAEFVDAVSIIEQSYNPIKSKQYIRAEYKDPTSNAWVNVPLGLTEVNTGDENA